MTSDRSAVPLDAAVLPSLPDNVTTPSFDRAQLQAGIVHIGVGGFHRAHLATYANELAEQGETGWGIAGAGVLAHDAEMADVLTSQDFLYTLITRGASDTKVEVIGSLIDFIHAVPDRSRLLAQIADPVTQIVSLTITEAGYPVDDQSGLFLAQSPAAGVDSTFGILAEALDGRRASSGLPLTILSCDNIMSNGAVARTALLGEAVRRSADLATWIDENCSFPNSMVDRITPVTTEVDIKWLASEVGINDRWPVVTEPFRQWVVEDRFAGKRPPLEQLDIIVTHDVKPYEFMKLRLLNAGHSCLAYLAALAGIDTVDEALATDWIREYLDAFLRTEAQPVLPEIPGIDTDAYIDSLIERFSNPEIGDQISRLCLDGSAKFPKFLLPTVRAQLDQGGKAPLSALALAGWCEYLLGPEVDGEPITPSADPLLGEAQRFAALSCDRGGAFLEFKEVFQGLATNDAFVASFSSALARIRIDGVPSAVRATLAEHAEN